MTTRLLANMFIAGGLLVAGCNALPPGSGRIVSDSRSVGSFTAVAVNSGLLADVEVAAGAAWSVTVVGDDNLVGYVSTSVAGDVLTVRLPDATLNSNRPEHLRIEITAPALTSLEAAGAADVTARGLAAETLSLSASGAGKLSAFGTSDRVDARASGAGALHARTLAAHDVVVHGDGGAEVEVCADGRLDLHLSAAASARYACSPTDVHKDVTSGASAQAE